MKLRYLFATFEFLITRDKILSSAGLVDRSEYAPILEVEFGKLDDVSVFRLIYYVPTNWIWSPSSNSSSFGITYRDRLVDRLSPDFQNTFELQTDL